jgi:hypothetical protein
MDGAVDDRTGYADGASNV